ncbi:MAG: phage scaffolding protein [Clostridioides sp.]|jgi:hypothetical protein|nr:phage scaffolding protein [Clostridioides sp.]
MKKEDIKEDIKYLGLTDEQISKIISVSTDELKGYIPKSRFDEVNKMKKQLETDSSDRDKQLEELKNSKKYIYNIAIIYY